MRVPAVVGSERIDAELVEATALECRAIWVSKGLEAAEAVGRLVLERFYGGRLAAWRRIGTGHPSVAALAAHPRLGMGRTKLWNCLRLLEQLEELPEAVGRRLKLSHHEALFKVPDVRTRRRLAAEAVRGHWKLDRLRARVAEVVPRPAARPASEARTWLRGVQRLVDEIEALEASVDVAGRMSARRREDLAERLRGVGARAVVLAERLDLDSRART